MDLWREFHGPNAGWVVELYERYRRDPNAVDAVTRQLFERWAPPVETEALAPTASAFDLSKVVGAVNLAHAIRGHGHRAARLDPLGAPPPGDPLLLPSAHGLTESDLRSLPASLVGRPIAEQAGNALEAVQVLRRVYSGPIGYDYDHVREPAERDWLRHAAETGRFRPPRAPIDGRALLALLTRVETFERFLHRIFPGKTRFSIEGLDMLVAMLDEILGGARSDRMRFILIGMAHRGRLNVLAHILHKPYAQVLAEFKDPIKAGQRSKRDDDLGWTGDVKYHLGGQLAAADGHSAQAVVTLAPNPSHLEAVNPVVEGMARAAGSQVDERGSARFDPSLTLPILIHGDLAFPGQGIVAETLNLAQLPGWHTGGTLHIIANNQLGFTTPSALGRSTLYASDLAKGFEIPIVHVNADEPEACLEAARLAYAYRARFRKDFLIDLFGYRRYGHNEGDEPAFTQPLMYRAIEQHPTVRERWAQVLVERGQITPDQAEAEVRARMEELQSVLERLPPDTQPLEPVPEPPPRGAARRVDTAVPAEKLLALHRGLHRLPDGFTPHPKLARALERRRGALDDLDHPSIDWALAEQLALASILADGTPIRLTGEDVERGTFSQRHSVFHDARTGAAFTPLQALPQAQATFEVYNSPLSEAAAVGFEYGYNVQQPERLVMWEAQYGDFINSAQVIIDEFIVSARAKWGQTPSLVLLLPHGHEGQGPDHSTGRLERFLSLAAETNVRIANCTTSAQYFHLLRRQAHLLKADPLPLIVMTPKSLLRHPGVTSSPRQLAEGRWQPVIDDALARQRPEQVRRLVWCSGKVYFDLTGSPRRTPAVAIARVEQLYPFRPDDFQPIFEGYPGLQEVVWLQEEPANMGAWEFLRPHLEARIAGRWPLHFLGRPRNASPAEGSSARHALNQQALVERAFGRALEAVSA
ncbi:MAG: 2-oxoglutarate dehydrogenase E1 component [Anaerolineales bacterium]|nr:2-oxoglutarate dehydrogenase E1 component [Anaerolineales bacterium]